MKNKSWIWLLAGIVFIVLVVLLFIRSTKNIEKTSTPEIPNQKEVVPETQQINYQTDSNFAQLHPKAAQFSTDITGEEMNTLTLEENALIWEVNVDEFVNEFNSEFNTNAKSSDKLEDVLPNYKNSNRQVKIILENLK